MSTQRQPHNSGAVRHLQQEHPPGCSFFILSVHTSQTVREHQDAGGTTAGRDKDAQAAMVRYCHRRADAPVAFPPLRRTALKTSLPRPIPSMASVPLASCSGPTPPA